MEVAIPLILRREMQACSNCASRFIRFLIKRFLTARGKEVKITKEDIWIDSDESDSEYDKNLQLDADIWDVLKIDPDALDFHIEEAAREMASKGFQTLRLPAEEIDLFAQFKEHLAEEKRKRAEETASEIIPRQKEDKKNEIEPSPP